jgi:lipopolysaccharide/colanic/teichoic acid biosynthesis glycosyltransferase
MLVVVASIYVIGVLERARPSRRARAAARRSVHAPLLPAMVAIGSSSPSGAIETARTSVYPTARRGTDTIIRVLDVVLSGVLLLLLFPLLALIGAVVVVTSGRPVFHSGERVGLHGDVFRMWKFRTLRPDAELRLGPFYGAELDRRLPAEITRVGRVLRATHLDEMPQLLSVVVGDMSIVGPRPLRPRFFEELCDEIPRYWQRLTVRPGVTGLAQTRIDRGASWEEKLAHDLEWIADRSVYLYVRTILATVWRVVVAVVTLRWRSIDGEDD